MDHFPAVGVVVGAIGSTMPSVEVLIGCGVVIPCCIAGRGRRALIGPVAIGMTHRALQLVPVGDVLLGHVALLVGIDFLEMARHRGIAALASCNVRWPSWARLAWAKRCFQVMRWCAAVTGAVAVGSGVVGNGARRRGGRLGRRCLRVRLERKQRQGKQHGKQAHRGGSCERDDTADFRVQVLMLGEQRRMPPSALRGMGRASATAKTRRLPVRRAIHGQRAPAANRPRPATQRTRTPGPHAPAAVCLEWPHAPRRSGPRAATAYSAALATPATRVRVRSVTNSSAAVGWMPMVRSKSCLGRAHHHRDGQALHDLRRILAQHVHAEHFLRRLVHHQLHHRSCAAARSACAASA